MIEVRNFTKNEIDEGWFREKTERVLEIMRERDGSPVPAEEDGSSVPAEAELSLAIVGDGRMRKLNKLYRGKNKVTDVLAFEEKSAIGFLEEEFIYPPDDKQRLGEIVICYPRAKKQAKKMGHSLEKELTILLIHGILHLMGYDHERDDDLGKMKEMERKISSSLKA